MAPRNVEVNEQIKDERHSHILLTALKIFTRKGFSATKMSDIANEAGISYGLAYHYFNSKEEIYTELIKHAVTSIGKVIENTQKNVKEPKDQIRSIIMRVLDSVEHKETSCYYYVLVMNALTCEAIPISSTEIIKEAMARLSMFADIIAKGQQKGQIREGDPGELAITCFSAVIGIASLKVTGAIKQSPSLEILMHLF